MKHGVMILVTLAGMLIAGGVRATCWMPVLATSKISFDISQAGAPLQGTFSDYSGRICIDPDQPASDRIQVQIRMASVDTQLPELDEALRGADFFDVAHWPQANFESDSVQALGNDHYEVKGKLTLRDVTRSITVPFTLQTGADGAAQLAGQLSIQRLDYHIGLGQWADTQWVGNQVSISFSVALKPAKPN
ncbi:MAG: YceI family protein [bacterium]